MELYDKIKENKYILKMVVLGDVGVGKTNIIRRILNKEDCNTEETIGVEFTYVDINDIDQDDPEKKLSIQIWDTCIYINIIIYIYKISWS